MSAFFFLEVPSVRQKMNTYHMCLVLKDDLNLKIMFFAGDLILQN